MLRCRFTFLACILKVFLAGCGLQDPVLFRYLDNQTYEILPKNFSSGAVIASGFLSGTAPASGIARIRVRFDGGAWRDAIGTQEWRVALPCPQLDGLAWNVGTSHTVQIAALSNTGVTLAQSSWSIRQGINRDINGDGFGDVAAGAYRYNSGTNQGQVYLFYSQGAQGVASQSAANASATLTGGAGGDSFGYSVAVGDVNGDGFADVVVGAYGYNGFQGRVYVFHSQGTAGVSTQDVSTASTVLTGASASDQLGTAVAVGDPNGDGYGDVAANAEGYNAGQGRIYIFHSQGAAGVATQGAGTASTTLTGSAVSDQFGHSFTFGDTNGDGYSDVVAGAYGFLGGRGRAYVFHSQGAAGIATQGVATASTTLTTAALDTLGIWVGAGDTNGDGYSDVVVGSMGFNGGTNQGRVYVFHSQGAAGVANLAVGAASTILTGGAAGNFFGNAVAVGDVNGDRFADVIAGAVAYNASQGRAYIFHSQGAAGIASQGTGTASTTLTGEAVSDQFGLRLAIGDLNADGYGDVFVYANGMNPGRFYIFQSQGGSGVTTQGAATATAIVTGLSDDLLGFALPP